MHVLILIGSSRLDSHSKALGMAMETSLRSQDARVTSIELAAAELPHADPTFHRDPRQHTDIHVQKFVRLADEADAFVFLSPIYHNSYSALLKNALDHLAIAQFSGKVIGLGSHGGNRSMQAVDHLRIVARGLNGISISNQVCTQDADYTKDEQGYHLTDPSILERVERFTHELVRVGKALNTDVLEKSEV